MKGICSDGTSVDIKVRKFQLLRKNDDFIQVQKYYDDFKDHWFKQVDELVDKEEFETEWHAKLLHSMETYKEDRAVEACQENGWSMEHKFNRWFYAALKNWISNIKTQAFRSKRRPGIVCPICFKEVIKIEEKHLLHIRTTRDVVKVFELNGSVYKTMLKPRKEARVYLCNLKEALKKPSEKTIVEKWPWKMSDGKPGVFCPYTKKIVPIINDEYLLGLSKKYRHYAKPYTWFEFQEEFPNYMVHSEIMSLDYENSKVNGKVFVDMIGRNRRLSGSCPPKLCHPKLLKNGFSSQEYEHAVNAVDTLISDDVDNKILKHIMVGIDFRDICEELSISKKELRFRISKIKNNKKLETILLSVL